jgi:hypothetical protein
MTSDRCPQNPKDPTATTSFSLVIVHLVWLFLGPFALGLMLLGIMQSGSGWWTGLDLALLFVVAAMICARWIDQRSGQATTVYGEPSTWVDFRRYALTLPALAGAAWIVANVIGNHVLTIWGG